MEIIMKKLFTPEEIKKIEMNSYVIKATPSAIYYSLEFKELALAQMKSGKKSTQIFCEAGFDVELLGRKRVYSAIDKFKEQAASPKGLTEIGRKKDKIETVDLSKEKTDKAISELQDEVIHLKRQIEFLKKISMMDQ